MSTNLDILKDMSIKRKTQQQQYLAALLDEKWANVSELLDWLIEIATLWFSSLIYGNNDDWPKETAVHDWQ